MMINHRSTNQSRVARPLNFKVTYSRWTTLRQNTNGPPLPGPEAYHLPLAVPLAPRGAPVLGGQQPYGPPAGWELIRAPPGSLTTDSVLIAHFVLSAGLQGGADCTILIPVPTAGPS